MQCALFIWAALADPWHPPFLLCLARVGTSTFGVCVGGKSPGRPSESVEQGVWPRPPDFQPQTSRLRTNYFTIPNKWACPQQLSDVIPGVQHTLWPQPQSMCVFSAKRRWKIRQNRTTCADDIWTRSRVPILTGREVGLHGWGLRFRVALWSSTSHALRVARLGTKCCRLLVAFPTLAAVGDLPIHVPTTSETPTPTPSLIACHYSPRTQPVPFTILTFQGTESYVQFIKFYNV